MQAIADGATDEEKDAGRKILNLTVAWAAMMKSYTTSQTGDKKLAEYGLASVCRSAAIQLQSVCA